MKFPKTPEKIALLLVRVQKRAARKNKTYVLYRQWGRLVLIEKPRRYTHVLGSAYYVVTPEKIKLKTPA